MLIFQMVEGSHCASSSPKIGEARRCQHRQGGNSGGKDKIQIQIQIQIQTWTRRKLRWKRQNTNTEDKKFFPLTSAP